MRRTFMVKIFAVLILILLTALGAVAQSDSSTQSAPAAKPATTAKPAVHHAATVSAAKPTAVIDTTVGKLTCTLFPDKAPIGVANFIGLATGTKDWKNPASGATKHKTPLYDGTIFHRVIPEFMIQGGDPKGDGTGDPGYQFKNEVSDNLLFDKPGRMAYANSGPDTNGSQFFITEDVAHSQHLSGHYTIFGQCDEASVELVKKIARMATDPSNHRPFRPVKIIHVSIVRAAGTAAKPSGATVKKPAATKPAPSSN
jgi:peptidyl-prolyl cis-trans isomerase A (cyclophilin A)